MKTRREFIQGLILSVGGAATLSACGDNAPAVMATAPHNPGRFYTGDEMALVNRVSDWYRIRNCKKIHLTHRHLPCIGGQVQID